MNFITAFKRGSWLKKAKVYAYNPKKMKVLLTQLGACLSRKGLREIKDSLLLMRDYLRDVTTGKYKEYSTGKMLLVVASIIYVVSPFDFLPDLLPGGLIDDVSIAVWVMKEVGDELKRYKERLIDTSE